MNFYQFHIADFALHTSHLTLEEEAVYRRLLDYYYDTESPIPTETQQVIRRLRLGSYSDIVGSILEEFFVLEDDGWHNLRADMEILEYRKRQDRARKNGKKGGRPKKIQGQKTQSVSVANPDETQTKTNHEPRTNNHEPINNTIGASADAETPPPKKPPAYPDDFEAIWSAYPKREGANPKNKAYSAYKARLREGVEPGDMAAGTARYAAFVRHKGSERTEFVMQAQRFFGTERAFENDWMITEAQPNENSQQRTRPMSRSDQADEAYWRYMRKIGKVEPGSHGESMEIPAVLEAGSFGRGQP